MGLAADCPRPRRDPGFEPGEPFAAACKRVSGRLLQVCVVLLGFGMGFAALIFQSCSKRERTELEIQAAKVPWFIALFLLANVLRSYVPSVALIAPWFAHLTIIGLTLTLFLIGAGLSVRGLRSVGWRPLLQGLLLGSSSASPHS